MSRDTKKLGIYIHVPFCAHKCAYCDFYSIASSDLSRDMKEYTAAVTAHIRSKKHDYKHAVVDTIFFGGGTPSLLPVGDISKILETIRSIFKVTHDAEITIEANPGTLDSAKLAAYKKMGINRLSLGLQSADDGDLSMLTRIHTRSDFETSYMLARMEGFDNINIDLMYALPHQTKQKLFENINYVLSMNPEHISLYGLTVYDNTPLGQNDELLCAIPEDDEQLDMYISACKKLEERGYQQYEISNFAKKKNGNKKHDEQKKPSESEYFFCRHNIKYWTNEEYLSFGPAAASFVDKTEYQYVADLKQYVKCFKDEKGIRVADDYTGETENVLDADGLEFRYLMTGFRLRAGINTAEYSRLFGKNFEKKYLGNIEKYIKQNYIVKTMHGYRFTRKGIMISNTILTDMLDFKSIERFASTNEVKLVNTLEMKLADTQEAQNYVFDEDFADTIEVEK